MHPNEWQCPQASIASLRNQVLPPNHNICIIIYITLEGFSNNMNETRQTSVGKCFAYVIDVLESSTRGRNQICGINPFKCVISTVSMAGPII